MNNKGIRHSIICLFLLLYSFFTLQVQSLSNKQTKTEHPIAKLIALIVILENKVIP